jgi:hypothetical protein
MAFTGYRAYRGVGGIGSVDFTTPVGSVPAGNGSITLAGLGHAADTAYTYVLRPVLDDLETPDVSCVVTLVTDATGDWAGNRPGRVNGFTAEPMAGGKVRLRWRYRTPRGGEPPLVFAVYHGPSLPIDTSGAPDAGVACTADGRYATELSLTAGQTYCFAVAAVSAADVVGPFSVTGPVVAVGAAPAAPAIITT